MKRSPLPNRPAFPISVVQEWIVTGEYRDSDALAEHRKEQFLLDQELGLEWSSDYEGASWLLEALRHEPSESDNEFWRSKNAKKDKWLTSNGLRPDAALRSLEENVQKRLEYCRARDAAYFRLWDTIATVGASGNVEFHGKLAGNEQVDAIPRTFFFRDVMVGLSGRPNALSPREWNAHLHAMERDPTRRAELDLRPTYYDVMLTREHAVLLAEAYDLVSSDKITPNARTATRLTEWILEQILQAPHEPVPQNELYHTAPFGLKANEPKNSTHWRIAWQSALEQAATRAPNHMWGRVGAPKGRRRIAGRKSRGEV